MSYLMDLINARIASAAAMTLEKILETEVSEWKNSKKRQDMVDGWRYERGDQDILEVYRYTIGKNGQKIRLSNLPNAKIVDNQYAIALDKKTNHLLGQPITLKSDDKQELKALAPFFGARFMRAMRRVAKDAMQGGVGYLMPIHDPDTGELRFRVLTNYNVIPFYEDEEETKLDAFIYIHEAVEYEGTTKKVFEKVDFCTREGFTFFENRYGSLTRIGDTPQVKAEKKTKKGLKEFPVNWQKIPLIPFRYNATETPLLNRVRSLQDAINTILSTFQNNMEEDARNTILVLHNYDGTDLGEFRQVLAQIGVVKVSDDGARKGGVDTLTIEVNAENYRTILQHLKNALTENARSFDARDERMKNNPNQMNIQSMMLDMEMDANGMETEFQPALEECVWFISRHLSNLTSGEIDPHEIEFIFNRDTLIDETTVIQNIKACDGILSRRTQLEQHPWVDDVDEELKRLKEEQDEAMDEYLNQRRDVIEEDEWQQREEL